MTRNLGELVKKAAENYKNKTAFEIKRGIRVDRFSFLQMFSLGAKLATFLKKKGLKKGDKVVVLAPSMPEYVLVFFGSWIRGVIVVPIDVRTTEETVRKFVKLTKPKLGFTSKYLPHSFSGFGFPTVFLEDLVEEVKTLPEAESNEAEPGDVAEIVFTSGTTGVPKGVVLSNRNLLFDIEKVLEVFPLDPSWRILSVLPLSHAFAQVVDLLVCFSRGMKVVYLSRTSPLALKRALRKYEITCLAIVPQLLSLMLKSLKREAEQKGKLARFELAQRVAPGLPRSLRRLLFREVHQALGGKFQFFVCGSAPLDLRLAQAWENMGIAVFEGYGATEMTAGLSLNTPEVKKLGSVGKILPEMAVEIDEDEEIWARGENISSGYFKNPAKTKEAFVNGWYKSGDVGFLDQDGFLHILGRTTFKIVLPSGLKVYPEDVEKKLRKHPLVEEACVVGLKKDRGEAVQAVIVTPKQEMLNQIIDEVNQNLEEHQKIFSASVWSDDDFPRTPVLKIDRKAVLAWVEKGAGEGKKRKSEVKKDQRKDEVIAILAAVSGIPAAEIDQDSKLGKDLKLDSLARVELVSLLEEELGVGIEEAEISDQTTPKSLRRLIKKGEKVRAERVPSWPFEELATEMRACLQRGLVFPFHSLFVRLDVKGKENLARIDSPAIFVFNHLGPHDVFCVPRVLPRPLRKKLVLLADDQHWLRGKGLLGFLIQLLGGGLAITRKGRVKGGGLDKVGDLASDGFSVLLAPEGGFSRTGELGQFKPGVGMLAVELRLPVVPIKISQDYQQIFQPTPFSRWQNWLPKKRGKVTISVGEPLVFPKDASYSGVTERIREEMQKL